MKHGHAVGEGSPEYIAWANMIARCTRKSSVSYKYYGGRGIQICKAWLNSFESFLNHIGPRPTANHSLDRIDVNGHYEPGNVRWSTKSEQMLNRRNRHDIEIDGVVHSLSEWIRISGNKKGTILSRLDRGWTAKRAVFERA